MEAGGVDKNPQFLAVAVALLVTLPIFIWITLAKYPRSGDKTTPGNRWRRNRNLFGGLLQLALHLCIVEYIRTGDLEAVLLWATFVICAIANAVIVIEISQGVSKDILQRAHPDFIQESLRNNWKNTAVLAGLMFTIVATDGFPFDFELTYLSIISELVLREFNGGQKLDSDPVFGRNAKRQVQTLFFLSVSICFTEYFVSMLLASIP